MSSPTGQEKSERYSSEICSKSKSFKLLSSKESRDRPAMKGLKKSIEIHENENNIAEDPLVQKLLSINDFEFTSK